MSVSKDLTTAVNKWTTSSSSKPYPKNSLVDSSLNPPGYIPGYVASQQVIFLTQILTIKSDFLELIINR